MKTNVLLLLICFFCFSNKLIAQNTFPVLSMDVLTTPIADSTTGGLPDLSDSTLFNVKMHVSLFDTTMIDEIMVSLGDAGMTGSRLQHTFSWDVFGISGGYSYSRSGYNVTLDLGDYIGLLNYDAGVSIKRTDNTEL